MSICTHAGSPTVTPSLPAFRGPGVLATVDVRATPVQPVAPAAGGGALAVTLVHCHLEAAR